tara:strand:- start:2014 stop:2943 length:930 start_codon:yes stop_codon:yes gene_type:complete
MIKKLGFFDILNVLKADMPDFSIQKPDNIGKPLKFIERLLICLNIFGYDRNQITFISQNTNSINGLICIRRIPNRNYWIIRHLLLEKVNNDLLKKILDSSMEYIAKRKSYGVILRIPNNWQLVDSAASAKFKIASQNVILTLGGQNYLSKSNPNYLSKSDSNRYKSELDFLYENTLEFFVKKNLTYYDIDLVKLCSMVDVNAEELIYLDGNNFLGSLSKKDYHKMCAVSLTIIQKYFNLLPELIFEAYQLAKKKQLYWIVNIQSKAILDSLHNLGLINQVSFYTLVYQTQSKIYNNLTSKVKVSIEVQN